MRQMVKSATVDKGAEGHFSIGSGPSSTLSTPQKPRTASSTVSPAGSTKRKRTDTGKSSSVSPLRTETISGSDRDGEYELDTEFMPPNTPSKKLSDVPLFSAPATPGMDQVLGQTLPSARTSLGFIKGDEAVGDGSPVKRQPSLRSRRATAHFGMVSHDNSQDHSDDLLDPREDSVESSASDYVPDPSVFDDDEFA